MNEARIFSLYFVRIFFAIVEGLVGNDTPFQHNTDSRYLDSVTFCNSSCRYCNCSVDLPPMNSLMSSVHIKCNMLSEEYQIDQ